MKSKSAAKALTLQAYAGDAMALIAFSLDKTLLKDFTGFSIRVKYETSNYFIFNKLSYDPKVVTIPHKKTDNLITTEFSPIQKFNWVYVPATYHHINKPFYGNYNFEVTPRYLVKNELQPLDNNLTSSITVKIQPFKKGDFHLGFTRGFVASQAYIDHFGDNNNVRPNKQDLIFDLNQKSGPVPKEKNKNIKDYTYEDQFEWMGWQARERIYELLEETVKNKNLSLDVFAYDLDEPIICRQLIALAKQGRVRIISDNATLHTGKDKKGNPAYEDSFEKLFKLEAKDSKALFRGRFSRFSHSKVFIQKDKNDKALKVLTGSTNFSTNGLYINSNHIIIFDNPEVADLYKQAFDESFGKEKMSAFRKSALAGKVFDFKKIKGIPDMTIRFSPHSAAFAKDEINQIAKRVKDAKSDILFAVMNDTTGSGDLLKNIREAHKRTDVFTYGIVDKSKDVTLYKPGTLKGVRVAGAGIANILPPPFSKENKIPGISIHHKFVVVDFKGKDPVVFCGSSNLAQLGEQQNGDNLIEIHDREIVTAFAVEAMRLIDHFQFRNRVQKKKEIFLYTTAWHKPQYDPKDLRFMERVMLTKENG